jgi:hypothetical protein
MDTRKFTRLHTRTPGVAFSFRMAAIMGRENARVFPLPVSAMPMTSRPDASAGQQ